MHTNHLVGHQVRFQRDCSDAELLELWTLALNVIEESSGPQARALGRVDWVLFGCDVVWTGRQFCLL